MSIAYWALSVTSVYLSINYSLKDGFELVFLGHAPIVAVLVSVAASK
jgi:hypothetical protein